MAQTYRQFLQERADLGQGANSVQAQILNYAGDDGKLDGQFVESGGTQAYLPEGISFQNIVDGNNSLYNTYQQGSGTPSPTAPTGGGTSGTPAPVLNQALVDSTQGTINEIPGLLQAALASEGVNYGNTTRGFDANETAQRKTHGDSVTTNQQNYDANFMDSIRAGIKGLGSLTQLLRGSGATGGTAQDQVKDIVGGITAQDIRGGADTQKENRTVLDTSLGGFLTDLKRKREVNEDTFENNKRAITRGSNTQLQDLYGKMAGFYSDADNTEKATEYINRSSALTPGIAENSRTQVSRYDTAPVVASSPELTAFAESSQPNAIQAPTNGQVGSGIFTIGDDERRRERELPVGV